MLRGVRARAPAARIVLVGYPAVTPRAGNGCYPLVPMSPDDLRYVDELIVRLNVMLAAEAAAGGAEFAERTPTASATTSARRRACAGSKASSRRPSPSRCTPTALGMQGMAGSVLRVLRSGASAARARPPALLPGRQEPALAGQLDLAEQTVTRSRPAATGAIAGHTA